MGLLPHRFKLSFRRPSPLPPPPPPPPAPPPEFLCSISGELMADPVIIPSGETFERNCIEASRDFSPPSSSSSSSSSLLLIPNSALRSAIIRWCDNAGLPRPIPISPSAASRLARKFPPPSSTPNSTRSPVENTSSSTSSDRSSSSSSSSEAAADPLEESIIAKLKTARTDDLEKTLISILESSRESAARRLALCTPRLLAALRGSLVSRYLPIRSAALAVVVNLSLEPPNKIRIVRSGAIPSIVDALQSSSRQHAAGAIFSLAVEEQNRTPIGVLGAIPPLIRLFCDSKQDLQTRIESGMAILYLGFAEMNMVKIGRISGVVKCLIGVIKENEIELRRIAMRLMVGMVGNKEGKSVMLDSGSVETMLMFLNEEEHEEAKMAVEILYGMSMGGLRFRGIARRFGAEEVLQRFAERFEGGEKEMAMMVIRVLRGEERERDLARVLWEEEDEVVEEMVVARRRLNRDPGGGSG